MKIFSGHVRKVIECPVLLGMANTSPESECMRNHGCRIFRITGKITQSEVHITKNVLSVLCVRTHGTHRTETQDYDGGGYSSNVGTP